VVRVPEGIRVVDGLLPGNEVVAAGQREVAGPAHQRAAEGQRPVLRRGPEGPVAVDPGSTIEQEHVVELGAGDGDVEQLAEVEGAGGAADQVEVVGGTGAVEEEVLAVLDWDGGAGVVESDGGGLAGGVAHGEEPSHLGRAEAEG
jgi:hypothetical protein